MKLPITLAVALATMTPATTNAQPAPPAEDPVAKARQLYFEGKSHYDVGEYAKAIEIWKRAYVISNAPMLLFNIAQAYRLSGDCTTAMKIYASYERESPNAPNKDELERAKTRCIREPTNANPPEPTKPAPAPSPTPSTTQPPTTPAQPATTPPQPATTASLEDGTLEPREPPMPPPRRLDESSSPGKSMRVAGIATAATGGVLVIASLVFAKRASNIAGEVEDYRGEWTAEQNARDADGRGARKWSLVTGIGGAVGVVAGGALYFMGRQRDRSSSNVALSIDSQHAEVVWSASF